LVYDLIDFISRGLNAKSTNLFFAQLQSNIDFRTTEIFS